MKKFGIFILVLFTGIFCYSNNLEVNAKEIYIKEGKMDKTFSQLEPVTCLLKQKKKLKN